MKILSWVQNKFTGKHESSKTNIYPPHKSQSQKEEFSDWPDGFLSIGTLGNKDLKEEIEDHNDLQSQNPIKDLTLEEVQLLHKELSSIISNNNLNCFSSLEGDDQEGKSNAHLASNDEREDDTNEPNKAKHVYLDNNNTRNVISKNSLSFLLKKMFVCGGGLRPIPSLRDPTLSPPMTRMEKILRAILHKKIYPQSPCQSMTKKKYLARKYAANANYNDDEDSYDGNNGNKWVKTDTDFIVLEI